jgi:fermentation-respiration switch protein FrsA (DUF1100 family)
MGSVNERAPPRRRWRAALAVVLLWDAAFWQKSSPRRFARLTVFACYGYVGVLLVLLALENRCLFPGASSWGWCEPLADLDVEEVRLTSSAGDEIHAWWSAPPGWTPARGAVLYSHGNGGNLSYRSLNVWRWRHELDRGVLIYDYPGYGKSSGRPSEAGCYAAADAAYDFLANDKRVPPGEVVLLGSSLGGAMATDLAVRRPHRMLILVNAFTSFPDMAQKVVPWLPARWLVRNQMNNLAKIAKCPGPVCITHGTADGLVPFSQGERLYAAAPEPKRFLPREGEPHAHPEGDAFYQAVVRFLDETRAK